MPDAMQARTGGRHDDPAPYRPLQLTSTQALASFEQRLKSSPKGPSFYKLWQSPSGPLAREAEPKLTRVAFRVSRLMEFCTRRELQNQTGHGVQEWPLVVLKELIDNALDAAEEAEVAPVISITVEPESIVIEDNGGGIETSTIKSILDYTIRVSSREAYVSPTRGAQGNALKTDPGNGLRARARVPGRKCRGGGRDDHRDPRRRAPDRVPGRPRQQRAEDHAHHLAVAGQDGDADHDQVAGDHGVTWTLREVVSKDSSRAMSGSTRI